MNEVQSQECYDAIGILLKYQNELLSSDKSYSNDTDAHLFHDLTKIYSKLLPCKHEEYTILDEIYAKLGSEVEMRIKCNNCNHLGVKAYMNTGSINWDDK